jgi:hypothetical protein
MKAIRKVFSDLSIKNLVNDALPSIGICLCTYFIKTFFVKLALPFGLMALTKTAIAIMADFPML